MTKRQKGTNWIGIIVVLVLIVGGLVLLLLPAVNATREAARRIPMVSEASRGASIEPHEGVGPGQAGDRYDRIGDNPFRAVSDHPRSTFSIDVDTASYSNVRRFLMQDGMFPPRDAVRIEELINYFTYDYTPPADDAPFATHLTVAECPWKSDHYLVRIGIKGKEFEGDARPPSNLVFLLDVSGSMNSPDKIGLLKSAMRMLVEQMRSEDHVAIVVYAGAEGLALPSTPGSRRQDIIDVLNRLGAGGSTNGGSGLDLAYRVAQEMYVGNGVNRIVLCTDGDFNVGTTSTGELVRKVEQGAKNGVFLSVLGFGRGNLNDDMMEKISNSGNGNYYYIDSSSEARKVLVEQLGGTLVTIAKDVKIQVEFNPARIAAYRLIGYENRLLAVEDFNDDKKDAGEIGAGHSVTALYEVIPVGVPTELPTVDPLKYAEASRREKSAEDGDELLTARLRYKQTEDEVSKVIELPLAGKVEPFENAAADFRFAAAVASFGMLLRNSPYKADSTYSQVIEIASAARGQDDYGYRVEFINMVRNASQLAHEPERVVAGKQDRE